MPDLFQSLRLFLLHQGDAADPELIHWLKDQMDEIIGIGPWGMVAATAAIVVAIPSAIALLYFYQQRHTRQGGPPTGPG